jgi:hypothetical protein
MTAMDYLERIEALAARDPPVPRNWNTAVERYLWGIHGVGETILGYSHGTLTAAW